MNTNIDGKRCIPYALTSIKGVGRRFTFCFFSFCLFSFSFPPSFFWCLLSPFPALILPFFLLSLFHRFAFLCCQKAEIDPTRRAGELNEEEVERLIAIMQSPKQFKIPDWMLNRQKDRTTGKTMHLLANNVDAKLRDDIERLKKIRAHRGVRHYWGFRVRGQHTKTTGRHGRVTALKAAR